MHQLNPTDWLTLILLGLLAISVIALLRLKRKLSQRQKSKW